MFGGKIESACRQFASNQATPRRDLVAGIDGSQDAIAQVIVLHAVDDGARPVRLKGEYTRNEDEQARYISELLDIFNTEGVDTAFVYTFARYDLPHRSNPREDFDLASRGIVKVLDGQSPVVVRRHSDMPWEPKAAFDTFAHCYGPQRAS